EEILPLLSGARMMAIPSRYEGFGLPGLEAMAAGVPVISTKMGALEEVYADAALYFECGNAEELAGKILELHDNGDLRRKMIEAGRARAAQFTWTETAQKTLAVYRKVCESNR
ncbi:MAG: glycosyltransferase, partial [Candidatus Coatesbacteria bacterium]|nr:glycosyltransferase [Candidatus Coatesbacteria bacterium]